jgi:hypothetical protein
MTPTRRYVLVSLCSFACVCAIVVAIFFGLITNVLFGRPVTPWDKKSALDSTVEWARLSSFPVSAEQFSITTEGNMFTRGFHVSFTAQPSDIEQWLQQSPGTRETSPTTPSPGIRHFKIAPGGGAQRAEVTVDDTTKRVFIYVAWS